MKVWACAAILGTLMCACGGGNDEGCGAGNAEACASADKVASQIRAAAMVDMIPFEGVCTADVAYLLEMAGYPGDVAARAAEYVAACEKYQALATDCKG